MKSINQIGIHKFEDLSRFSKIDRTGKTFARLRCRHCGLIARKLDHSNFVAVSDAYPDEMIYYCKKIRFTDKYIGQKIQTHCHIRGYPEIPLYSVHEIVAAPKGEINGEFSYWIKFKDELVQILEEECVFHPIHYRPSRHRTTRPPRKEYLLPWERKELERRSRHRTSTPAVRHRTVKVKRSRTTVVRHRTTVQTKRRRTS